MKLTKRWIILGAVAFLLLVGLAVLWSVMSRNRWEADFQASYEALNQRQMDRIVLRFWAFPFSKRGSLDYESYDRMVSLETSPDVRSSGQSSTQRKMKARFTRKGDTLTLKIKARPHYIPNLVPFTTGEMKPSGPYVEVEYVAQIGHSKDQLFLFNPKTDAGVCFSRSPAICHNPPHFVGADGVAPGYEDLRRRREPVDDIGESYAPPVKKTQIVK